MNLLLKSTFLSNLLHRLDFIATDFYIKIFYLSATILEPIESRQKTPKTES